MEESMICHQIHHPILIAPQELGLVNNANRKGQKDGVICFVVESLRAVENISNVAWIVWIRPRMAVEVGRSGISGERVSEYL